MCVLCFDGTTVVKEVSVHGGAWGGGKFVHGMEQLAWCEGILCDTSDPCKGVLPESGTKQIKRLRLRQISCSHVVLFAKSTCHDQA